jgi:hypothetical protein
VLATAASFGELPGWALDGVTRISMHSYNLGGSAALVRFDGDELTASSPIQLECLTGVVR